MTFFCKTLSDKTANGTRTSVPEQEYVCYTSVRDDGLAVVVMTDQDYPSRVAFTLLGKVLDEFSKAMPDPSCWTGSVTFPALEDFLSKYQNPHEADALSKIHRDLDDTKVILVREIMPTARSRSLIEYISNII